MSTIQGAGEQQTELYRKYSKGVAEPATKKRAISSGRVVGSADKQADTSWVILPLFHPAAALYNGAMRQTLIEDFNKIPRVLAAIK
jgi:uracil-DNA glycosylase